MLRIAICDDEKIHINQLSTLVKSVLGHYDHEIEIHAYTSGYQLMDVISKHHNYFDIIFLDNLMPEMNGIEVAKNIRLYNELVPLIFVTSTKEYAFDSYQVKASHYILKPTCETELKQVLTEIMTLLVTKKQPMLTITVQNEIHKIPLASIRYFESKLRKITVYTMSEAFVFYEKMSNLEAQLTKKQFIRCHQSYIINSHYIRTIKNNVIILKNSQEIPISKKYQVDVKDMFLQYLNEQLR